MMHFIDLDTGTDQLIAKKRAGLAILKLNRPNAKNALSSKLTPALREMIKQLGEDDEVGAVLITGAGNAFCAGGDVKGMANSDGPVLTADQKILKLVEGQRQLTGALVKFRKPVVAALPGPAVGAGLSLALACDIRIGSSSSFVTTGYARVGLSGDYGISSLLTRAIGSGRARELLFTSERIDSERCLELGIYNRVVPDHELLDYSINFADELARGPRKALALMKDNLEDALVLNFEDSLDREAPRLIEATASSDHKEAVRAFVEKRKPVFGVN